MEIIKKLFPQYALRRQVARLRLQQVERAYEAGKPTVHYPVVPTSSSPNVDMERAGVRMRTRARSFDENLDIVTGLFDTLESNVVGNNNPIRPLVRNLDGTLNQVVNNRLVDLWLEWGKSPTICGGYSINKVLKLACRSWLRDGEFLTRFYRGSQAASREIPFALELIEADYLPFEKERQEVGKANIIQGVELNKYNNVLAYHLYKDHPEASYLNAISTLDTKRIKAADILHLKFCRRVHQIRGVTILHSVMNRLDDLKDYEESERIAARVAAAMTGYIKKPGEYASGNDPDVGRTFEMSPGMIFDNLLPGEEINTIQSNRPNPELINFRSSMLRAVAAGTKTNYSTISRDYNGTYSSQRQELLESKPGYEGLRQQFVDDYLGPIWREFIKMLLAAGTIETSTIDPPTIDHIEIRGINIGWIDPKKQADATSVAIETGITTRGQVIRDQGGDPAAVFAEREEEKKLFPDPIIKPEKKADETDEQDQD